MDHGLARRIRPSDGACRKDEFYSATRTMLSSPLIIPPHPDWCRTSMRRFSKPLSGTSGVSCLPTHSQSRLFFSRGRTIWGKNCSLRLTARDLVFLRFRCIRRREFFLFSFLISTPDRSIDDAARGKTISNFHVPFAEAASCQLEFKYLAKLTGRPEYYHKVLFLFPLP